ncbi:MAG: TrkH family potassium uptake protein [Alphaproteobacteria bacterium]|nr:TrkH family potassium uptake protein [Alphaproteobacteria bacterium]
MIDFRPILFIVGILMSTLALAMCVPAVADAAVGNKDWQVFTLGSAFTLLIGVMLLLTARSQSRALNLRQAFVLTTLSWMIIPAFGALPLAFADLQLSYTDAFFEAMSGITTTGSTILTGLDYAPPGILLWRALLQWLGGIGIVAMAVAILPMLQVGGMQLFRMESSDSSDKVLPRATQLIAFIGFIYLGMTMLCALLYWSFGMTGFDAVTHAMTTIATGGFSTHDESLGYFKSGAIDAIASVFMLLGSLPFVLYLRGLRGNPGALWRDSQVRWFLAIVLLTVLVMSAYLHFGRFIGVGESIQRASFNVISVITGTGYATADFNLWGTFAVGLLFFLMFVGGCAGSTTCGVKVFRLQVLYATALSQIRRLLEPHGVFIAYYNGKPIPDSVGDSVMSFFFLYVLCFAALAIGLSFIGLDFLTAASGAATAISNVGPGLGTTIGPAGNFATLPDSAKWLLSAGMLLGRLELFTVLVMLAPSFWRS